MIPGVRLIMLGRQGAGKGTQCVRLSRHYVVPAHLHRRHPAGGGQGGHRPRAQGQGDHGRGRARARRHHDRHRRRAARQGRRPDPGLHPRRLPPHGAPGRGAGRDHRRAADRRRGRPGGARGSWCCSGWPPGGSARTAAPTTRRTGLEKSPWFCEVCGGDVVQRTDDTEEAINRRLDLYETPDPPLIEYYDEHGLLAVVDGVGHARRGDDPARRRHRRPLAGSWRREGRHPPPHGGRAAHDAGRRPGRGRDARPDPGRHPPRGHDRRPRPHRPRGARAPRGARRTSSATTATRP